MSSDKCVDSVSSHLIEIIGEKDTVKPWEILEVEQQKKIEKGIASSTPPNWVVYPHTQEQLAKVIAEAYRQDWRVLVCGSSSKISWGDLVEAVDIVVSTERINKLIDHAVGDLTVTVEAGMKFCELQSILTTANQFLALDPAIPQDATIGGIVATANTGSFRQRYGSVRDQLLGISFVRADGEIARAGGRVVKNVAGYDLMKLFTGSYGSLGVITQVTFRVYPTQQASETVLLTGDADGVSTAATTLRASALTPTQADLLSTQLVSDLNLGSNLGLIVRFQNIPESVSEQSNRLLEVGKKLGLEGTKFSGSEESDLWKRLQEQIYFTSTDAPIVCKIGILPSAAMKILNSVGRVLIHNSSGLGVARFEHEGEILKMRNLCQSNSGFLSVLMAPVLVKSKIDVWGYNGNALELMQGIKKQFDPKNILNPGRFI
ncbi:FAD-binding oxidoreductase [Mastigocoleus testarum]|uniref:Glycolate oxidase n=1 Tax=Mastigocoleus testarum BC008 TaxID=371196 RepID=A0A0V7ZJP9_9CYAN|nr:FAD-binding oxidoreductase [Mastigocoleus testarum]KST64518.1 glycolate oxidase [Mastigocoleus testarum BC008]